MESSTHCRTHLSQSSFHYQLTIPPIQASGMLGTGNPSATAETTADEQHLLSFANVATGVSSLVTKNLDPSKTNQILF
jgi:hypothetical protein